MASGRPMVNFVQGPTAEKVAAWVALAALRLAKHSACMNEPGVVRSDESPRTVTVVRMLMCTHIHVWKHRLQRTHRTASGSG
jgi:hypothetical protein